ncbi:MAG: FAD-binding protein [Candidatus Eisenbacteria bacterium]|nr:FAD-binding protein [Candidatus Eisenbacteria bacterium]
MRVSERRGFGSTRLPDGFAERLSRVSGVSVSTAIEDRICYSYDATDVRALPDAVAWPESSVEVADVLRAAREADVPVVPRGAGTGYTGGSLPVVGGIGLSLERMNTVSSIDTRALVALAGPGVVNEALAEAAEAGGLSYPPDPASRKVSTVGGNIAECAGGPATVLHGTTRDYVAGLEAVLSDGSVVSTGILSGERRTSWDAGPLLVGSEGTLSVVTDAALRLTPAPEATGTFWIEFADLESAARAVAAIVASALPVSSLELIDRDTYVASHEFVRGARPERDIEGGLLVELEGTTEAVSGATEQLGRLADEFGATGFRSPSDDTEREEIREIRRSISPSLARLATGKANEDITVPRSRIPDFVHGMRAIGREHDLRILSFGHAGDGNLHVNVMFDRDDVGSRRRARAAVDRLFQLALSLGGTLSGEHGIGITKADQLASELEETALEATAAVKRALDPDGILNPEKILTHLPNPWWGDLDEAPC